MKIVLATILAATVYFVGLPACVAQVKTKDGKTPNLKETYVELKGVRVRALLPENAHDSAGSNGSVSKAYSKDLEGRDGQRLTILVPNRGKSPINPGPEVIVPEKDPEGKFVQEYLEAEAKRLEIKYDTFAKVELNGYVGREAYHKPQEGKGFMGGKHKFSGQAIRMFAVNQTLVSVEISWDSEPPSKEVIKKLFDSFKIELIEKVEMLNGHWVVEKWSLGGKENPELKGRARFEFAGNQMWMIKQDGTRGREIQLRMHPGGVKGAIDIGLSGFDWEQGIYKLEGDTLSICCSREMKPRPTTIAEGKDAVYIQMKREKKK